MALSLSAFVVHQGNYIHHPLLSLTHIHNNNIYTQYTAILCGILSKDSYLIVCSLAVMPGTGYLLKTRDVSHFFSNSFVVKLVLAS